jgi:hypothetical protein
LHPRVARFALGLDDVWRPFLEAAALFSLNPNPATGRQVRDMAKVNSASSLTQLGHHCNQLAGIAISRFWCTAEDLDLHLFGETKVKSPVHHHHHCHHHHHHHHHHCTPICKRIFCFLKVTADFIEVCSMRHQSGQINYNLALAYLRYDSHYTTQSGDSTPQNPIVLFLNHTHTHTHTHTHSHTQ